jgi:hypothetical protein
MIDDTESPGTDLYLISVKSFEMKSKEDAT